MSRARQLTFVGRRAGEGYFSPDGGRLVFQSERYRDNPFFQIYTLDLKTGRTRLISPGVGATTCSYFRPGTDEVMFASTHLDPEAKDKQRQEYEKRADPNASRVPWDYDPYYDIFSTDERGRNIRRLTDAFGYDAEGAYSPDGKLIVFTSMRDAYPLEKLDPEQRKMWDEQPSYFADLYVMNADGSEQRRLFDWPGYDGGPFFAGENDRIIWRHFEKDGITADIYTMKIDGTEKRRLTDFGSMCWAPFMHPSREYAIFTTNKMGFQNFELYMVDALGEKRPVRVTHTDGFDGLPVFSPDGNRLCWTSNRATMESRKGQLFMADWDHAAALAAVKAVPPRGTPEGPIAWESKPANGWPSGPPPAAKEGLVSAIAEDDLYEHVRFLASDDLEGRMTGSPGARKAADYIAERFRNAGLEPLGDDSTFFQTFEFPAGVELVPEQNSLALLSSDDSPTQTFEVDSEYRPLSFTNDATVTGEVVATGYGLVMPEDSGKAGYDSYEDLDVKDKVVLVFDDVPAGLSTDERIRWVHYSSPRYKAMQAIKRGAAGFLLVIGPNTPGSGGLMPLARTDTSLGIAAVSISEAVAERLIKATGFKLADLQGLLDDGKIPKDFRKANLGVHVELTTRLARKMGTCRNVIGLLPPAGDGPIAEEYVLMGAHYDHIGRGEAGGSRAVSGEEGQIHNGADDNASGTATLLELAAVLAKARKSESEEVTRRGIIFAAWSGEEIGTIGSSHFARHAPCPLGQIAAYVNFDMVGRLSDGRLILQGAGSSPDWLPLIEMVNIREPLAVVIQQDPYLPTDTHEFYPSGVPVLSFFTDVHDDYNRPTDDAVTLNYPGMEAIARFAMEMTTELAQSPTRPTYAEVERAAPKGAGGGGRRIYTGTIPDFAAGEVGGMKISGATAGSPAEKAGLIGGDIIVEIAGHKIAGLEDYAAVLRALKPDEPVEIFVKRGESDKRLTITPTLRQ